MAESDHRGSTRMYMGESVKRREDWRFLTGRGRYIDDIAMPGAVHAAFVRSSHAHAMISIDTAAAKAIPGVLVVLTGEAWTGGSKEPRVGEDLGSEDDIRWC